MLFMDPPGRKSEKIIHRKGNRKPKGRTQIQTTMTPKRKVYKQQITKRLREELNEKGGIAYRKYIITGKGGMISVAKGVQKRY